MSEQQIQLTYVRGHVSELPSEDQTLIHQCRDEIRVVMSKFSLDNAAIALALVGLEKAVEEQ